MTQIITDNAELMVFNECALYGVNPTNNMAIQCVLSGGGSIDTQALHEALIQNALNPESKIFTCDDGDVFIIWKKTAAQSAESLKALLMKHGSGLADDALVTHDFANGEEHILKICRDKLVARSKDTNENNDNICAFTPQQQASLIEQMYKRKNRGVPEILIVEDQLFSSKLLTGMLGTRYVSHVAETGKLALQLYSAHAPDMVFLDINLPDMTGHDIATLVKASDVQSKIVMVTANNYAQDVNKAKNNAVEGFIAKPFNKEKITASVTKLLKHRYQ